MEANTGSGYADLGTKPFQNVPYALYSKSSGSVVSSTLEDLTDVNTVGASAGQVLTFNGTAWVPGSDNDAQTLSLSGSSLSISNGNSVILPDNDTDDQTLSLSGDTLSIQQGNSINLTSFLDNTDAQTLSFSAGTLSISGGNSVNIDSAGPWLYNGNNIYYVGGNVGIGKIPQASLDIAGKFVQIGKDSAGRHGLVKNTPNNTPGYNGSLIIGYNADYGTIELHHQLGGYGGGPNVSNYFTTFNTTEGGVSAGERMRIAPNGNIGIGTTAPRYPLEIAGLDYRNYPGTQYGYLNFTGAGVSSYSGPGEVSLYAEWRILTQAEFNAVSDERIKKDFKSSDNQQDLTLLSQIEVTDFRYKDVYKHGSDYKKGFIAQQVRQVFPQAVSVQTDFIPDIFSLPEKAEVINDTMILTMRDAHALHHGDEVRLITSSGRQDVKVLVIDDHTFAVNNWNNSDTDIFVYGKKVNDFLAIDYDRIYTLNVGATQQLIKRVDALEKENSDLKQKALEMQILKAQMKQLKNEMESLKSDGLVKNEK